MGPKRVRTRFALADLADPAVLVLEGAVLNARERFAKLLHHRADLGATSREDNFLIGAVDLVVDLTDWGDNRCGAAQAALNELATGNFLPAG